jgi:hypothetical protein
MMSIPGVENASEFKNMILNQREKVIKSKNTAPVSQVSESQLLLEIKNELSQIKDILKSK